MHLSSETVPLVPLFWSLTYPFFFCNLSLNWVKVFLSNTLCLLFYRRLAKKMWLLSFRILNPLIRKRPRTCFNCIWLSLKCLEKNCVPLWHHRMLSPTNKTWIKLWTVEAKNVVASIQGKKCQPSMCASILSKSLLQVEKVPILVKGLD